MRAVVMKKPGGPEVLEIRDVEDPVLHPGHVLVDVAATAINRADLIQRRGFYKAPPGWPQDILGLEFAGTVAAVGDGVTLWKPGDRVMGLVGGGAYAEKLTIDSRQLIPAPRGMDLTHAAAIPEAFVTAWDAAMLQGNLEMGESLLIHAAASGVGTAAIQLARTLACRTIGTSRTESKLARCRQLGLEVSLVTDGSDFADAVLDATGGEGVHVILDLVGGAYLDQNLKAVRRKGAIVVVGLVSGTSATLDMRQLLRRRIRVMGTALRTRPAEEKARLARRFAETIVPLFDRGQLAPEIFSIEPMDKVAEAHTTMENNVNTGKIVLRW